jgi:phosphoglycerate dehydrogenase-like enzyme
MGNAESAAEDETKDDESTSNSRRSHKHRVNMIVLAAHQHPATNYLLSRIPSNFVVVADGDDPSYFRPDVLADVELVLNISGDKMLLLALWPYLEKVKWIHSATAGVDQILFRKERLSLADATLTAKKFSASIERNLRGNKVRISCTRGLYAPPLAEWVIGCCLHFCKSMPRVRLSQREGLWDICSVRMLDQSTLGIVGFGATGRATARLAHALGMRVLACRKRPKSGPQHPEDDAFCEAVLPSTPRNLERIFRESDYLLVAVPLTTDTRGMVSHGLISLMKPTATLVSVSRTAVVDVAALGAALRAGSLGGVAMDLDKEGAVGPGHPLRQANRAVLSSSCAANVPNILRAALDQFLLYAEAWQGNGRVWQGKTLDEFRQIFVDVGRGY